MAFERGNISCPSQRPFADCLNWVSEKSSCHTSCSDDGLYPYQFGEKCCVDSYKCQNKGMVIQDKQCILKCRRFYTTAHNGYDIECYPYQIIGGAIGLFCLVLLVVVILVCIYFFYRPRRKLRRFDVPSTRADLTETRNCKTSNEQYQEDRVPLLFPEEQSSAENPVEEDASGLLDANTTVQGGRVLVPVYGDQENFPTGYDLTS